ncbi:MAG: glycosyltransferase domain-containing protein, partial [bacterium]
MRAQELASDSRAAVDNDAAASIVVYTAITAGYDDLREPPPRALPGAQFVAFLAAPQASPTWRTQPLYAGFDDPTRNAKIHKILPHRFFPAARYSLWLDGSVSIRGECGLDELVERYLADCDLAVFQHRVRTCVYQEASVCLQRGLDDANLIWRQVCGYAQEGYPSNAGLGECSVV